MRASEFIYDLLLLDYKIDNNCEITKLSSIENLGNNCVSFIESSDYFNKYKSNFSNRNLVVVYKYWMKELQSFKEGNFIYSDNPKLTFVKIANLFLEKNIQEEEIIIGEKFKVGKNCVLKNCIIGDNVTIHSGTIIGENGFGYVKDGDKYINFPHIGKVIIEDNVEIHSNVCIDRGSLSNTIIRRGAKIDNLVHIAHNVEIGENTFVIATSMIGGSTKIGKNCWIAPGSKIMDRIVIADNTTVGLGSVVLKSILNEGETWVGNPARKIK